MFMPYLSDLLYWLVYWPFYGINTAIPARHYNPELHIIETIDAHEDWHARQIHLEREHTEISTKTHSHLGLDTVKVYRYWYR